MGSHAMPHKTRILLAIGCVSLLALSIPAFSLPSPLGLQRHTARAVHGKQPSAKAQRKSPEVKLTSTRVKEPPPRPKFGWPVLVAEARKYLGTNPTARTRLWCATFMNLVLAKIGYPGTNSDAAKSFADYGHRITEPKVGAIAVLSRGKRGGHVGVVSGIDGHGNPIIISGNHGHRVAEAVYPRARVIAYVMPTETKAATDEADARSPATAQVADRSPPMPRSRPAAAAAAAAPAVSTTEPPSSRPITELLAAIDSEQSRPERPRQQAAAARSVPLPAPRRVVQHIPQPAPQWHRAGSDLPLDPALAGLLGIKDRAQALRPAPQRLPRVPQLPQGRVASANSHVAGAFALR